ncbi:hypothetical protein B0H17DRAFT_1136485 [Mycena rosella]|uniref:Uncharacterized protein n=1 Tax=Mycena rosella TaxID=1033263 RepID=A0AAD7GEG7_MYCRO|nr:hypothetical protein B0H17DRAFT_1136485 [Mycena rosella]
MTRRQGPGLGVRITCPIWKDQGRVLRRAEKNFSTLYPFFESRFPLVWYHGWAGFPTGISCWESGLNILQDVLATPDRCFFNGKWNCEGVAEWFEALRIYVLNQVVEWGQPVVDLSTLDLEHLATRAAVGAGATTGCCVWAPGWEWPAKRNNCATPANLPTLYDWLGRTRINGWGKIRSNYEVRETLQASRGPGQSQAGAQAKAKPGQAKAKCFGPAWDFTGPKPPQAGPKPWPSGQAKAKTSLSKALYDSQPSSSNAITHLQIGLENNIVRVPGSLPFSRLWPVLCCGDSGLKCNLQSTFLTIFCNSAPATSTAIPIPGRDIDAGTVCDVDTGRAQFVDYIWINAC